MNGAIGFNSSRFPEEPDRAKLQPAYELWFKQGENLGRWIGIAIRTFIEHETTQQNLEEATEASNLDPLTGLLNRRGLEKAYQDLGDKLMSRRRRGDKTSLLYVDLDRFKDVNDAYGHDVGDKLLTEVAGRFKEITRDDDILARTGGDEFILLLPQTSKEEAVVAATKLNEAVSGITSIDGCQINTTLSIGVDEINPIFDEFVIAAAKADQAMYMAKRAGRNQVIMAGNFYQD